MDLIGHHRKQHLPRTAELAEAHGNESDHFLEAQVRVKTKSEFAMPDIAERDRRASALAAPGSALLVGFAKQPRRSIRIDCGVARPLVLLRTRPRLPQPGYDGVLSHFSVHGV